MIYFKNKYFFIILSLLIPISTSFAGCDLAGYLQKVFAPKNNTYFQVDEHHYISGKSMKLDFPDDYSIQLIETSDGSVHAMDTEHGLFKEVKNPSELQLKYSPENKPFIEINKIKAKKMICSQYQQLKKNDDFIKIRRSLSEILTKKM